MTNRFTGEFDKQYSGVHDNGEQLTNFEVVDLLNNLSEEKEKLKKDCSNLIDDNTEYVSEMNHIKQVIKEAYQTERTALGKSVLKQILDNVEGEHEQHIYQN